VHKRSFRAPLIVAAAVALAACSHSSYLLLDGLHPAVPPSDVKVYSTPPADYEEIAVLQADGRRGDAAVERLKDVAGRLGANGVLIRGAGDQAQAIYVREILVSSISSPSTNPAGEVRVSPPGKGSQTAAPAASKPSSQTAAAEVRASPPAKDSQTTAPVARKPSGQTARKRVVGASFGPHPQGLAVLGIAKNSVAARAGLKVGDLITEIDGRPTAPIYWEYAAALLTSGGNTVTIEVMGRGELVLSFAPAVQAPSTPTPK
jgi:PDZ domain